MRSRSFTLSRLALLLLFTACAPQPTAAPIDAPPSPTPISRPSITSAQLDKPSLPRYDSLEMTVALNAQYGNPFDAREVTLDGVFTAPDGTQMNIPGFWDAKEAWRMRFTPSQAGTWTFALTVTDARGTSAPSTGSFDVIASELHGWLQVGNWVDPTYSSRYLVYQDGTAFYGLGHCDPLNILADGFSLANGVGLFDNMVAAGENYVVWWPLYSNSPIGEDYKRYSAAQTSLIDLVVKDAQKEGIILIFTIWDHPELRAEDHPWGNGRWETNGFRNLGSIDSFFTSAEAWAWQENFYRYIIARWGYSPAIGMWQTVSEINGTNAYRETDPWHAKVSTYFSAHDPYRHPTTASKSGDVDWVTGWQDMDAAQVHVYDYKNNDVTKAAETATYWTMRMWNKANRPNWIGEFGVPSNQVQPELFHNSIWAALASGAALTPAEWNDRGQWSQMTPEMLTAIQHLGAFVADLPLAHLNPAALTLKSSDKQVRGWGIAGTDGGLFWVQDFALEGQPIEAVRAATTVRENVNIEVAGLVSGTFIVQPYDTWQGDWLDPYEVTCLEGRTCAIALPAFKADMAFKLVRK